MIPSTAVQMVDKLFRDFGNESRRLGGKIVIYSGNFRQILCVLKHASSSKIINFSLK